MCPAVVCGVTDVIKLVRIGGRVWAPNKPLLVLAILDLVEAGLVGRRGWRTRT